MRCLIVVVLCVAWAGGVVAGVSKCSHSVQFFERYNATADTKTTGELCSGHCCGAQRESAVRAGLHRAAVGQLTASLRPIEELLLSTRQTLQGHLTALSHQSENKTAILFAQVYRGQISRALTPLAVLYEDIRTLLRSDPVRDATAEDLGLAPPKDLAASTRKFFRDVFPVVYHVVLKLDGAQFLPEYEACLKDAYDTVKPFEEIPQQMETVLKRSIEAARALLQVLAVGASAIATSTEILGQEREQCSSKLMTMAGCAHCTAHGAQPCRDYCLNVVRGCFGTLVYELDAPWNAYVEAVERLARADADVVLRTLDERVSKAIMHAIENHVLLEKSVHQECGPPSTTEKALATPRPTPGWARRDALRSPPPDMELLQFSASLATTKNIFAGISDGICDHEDFFYDKNDVCWVGMHVSKYEKTLVKSAAYKDQESNPEMTGKPPTDPRTAATEMKLRKATQLLAAHTWTSPVAESFMQGDEAGEEGSGSGEQNYRNDDADDDDDDDETGSGEGSGRGRGLSGEGIRPRINEEPTYHNAPPTTGASTTSQPWYILTIAATLLVSLKHYLT